MVVRGKSDANPDLKLRGEGMVTSLILAGGERQGIGDQTPLTNKRQVDHGMKVLFTDFDNCLHRSDAYRTRRGIVPADPNAVLFEYAPILELLLEPYPDVNLVLSTSWVEVLGRTLTAPAGNVLIWHAYVLIAGAATGYKRD